jgi:hypothetical protein
MVAIGNSDSDEDEFSESEEETKPEKTPQEMGFKLMSGKWVLPQGDKIYDQQGNELDPKTLEFLEQ